MLEAVGRPKIRDVVAERLRSDITAARLRPGGRLPTGSQLAARFGGSRLSLREANKSLEYLRVVESKPGLGPTVGQISFGRVAALLEFHPDLLGGSPEPLVRTRVATETGVLP